MTLGQRARTIAACVCMWAIAMAVRTDLNAQADTAAATSNQTLPGPATATFFPGSVSLNSGLSSPLEDANVITNLSVEQGVTLIHHGSNRLVPFVTMLASRDRRGFDWNNKILLHSGTKFVRGFRSGVVQFGAGYAYENRFNSGISQGRPIWFGNYWFGWQLSTAGRFPGSSWATVGTPAPTEQKNVIAMSSIDQGVAILKVAHGAMIPFIEHLVALDTAGRPWNNRQLLGEGIKFRVPIGRGTIEAAAVYKQERRWIERRFRAGPTAVVNLWYGWDPSGGN
jgi:hypothetical protein